MLACVSPEGELLGAGPGALTASESPAQAPQVCRKQGETTASKAEENAFAPGPEHPVLGIYPPGSLTQVHQDECAQQGSLESPG